MQGHPCMCNGISSATVGRARNASKHPRHCTVLLSDDAIAISCPYLFFHPTMKSSTVSPDPPFMAQSSLHWKSWSCYRGATIQLNSSRAAEEAPWILNKTFQN